MTLHTNNYAYQTWIENISKCLNSGSLVESRAGPTLELLDHNSKFDMNTPICYSPDRKLSYRFMAAEAYWITSGSQLVEDIAPYNQHIAQFSDDGYIFNGAYGPPFYEQLNYVVETLIKDKSSRQAVMTIWRPNPPSTKDYPCTVSLMFFIRDNILHTKVTMRSQDLFLGQPYDFFNFSIMALRVLCEYNKRIFNQTNNQNDCIILGTLFHSAFSTHIYQHNVEQLRTIVRNQYIDKMTEFYLWHNVNRIPLSHLNDWNLVVQSLLSCRDGIDKEQPNDGSFWFIRPKFS